MSENGKTRIGVVGDIEDPNGHAPLFTRLFNSVKDRCAWRQRYGWKLNEDYGKSSEVVSSETGCTYPEDLSLPEDRQLPGLDTAEVVALCPSSSSREVEKAEFLAEQCGIELVTTNPNDLFGNVDGVIVTNNPEMKHGRYPVPFLEEGVPVFVDKPLAGTYEEAHELIRLAEAQNTPLMSCSGLRYSGCLWRKRGELAAVGPIWLVNATLAICKMAFYAIHVLEPIVSIIGWEMRCVRNCGTQDSQIAVFDYVDGKRMTIQCVERLPYMLRLSFFGEKGKVDIELANPREVADQSFHKRTLRHFLDMIATGRPPIDLRETDTILKALFKAEESLRAGGTPVDLLS